MNVPDINRSILRMHIAAVEAKHPIKIIGLLPRGSAGHVFDDNALDFLAEKRPGLDLWAGRCGNRAIRPPRPTGRHRSCQRIERPRSRRISAARRASMNRSDLERLCDARDFARCAQDNGGGCRPEVLADAKQPQHAALYDLAIIGETLNKVSAEVKSAAPSMEWRLIADLRNLIVHAYWQIDFEIIADVIQNRLDPLIGELDGLIAVRRAFGEIDSARQNLRPYDRKRARCRARGGRRHGRLCVLSAVAARISLSIPRARWARACADGRRKWRSRSMPTMRCSTPSSRRCSLTCCSFTAANRQRASRR